MCHPYASNAWGDHCNTKGHKEHVANIPAEKEKEQLKHKKQRVMINFFLVKRKKTPADFEESTVTGDVARGVVDLTVGVEAQTIG